MKLININVVTDNPHDSTSFYRALGVFNQIRKRENLPINLHEEPRFGWNTVGKYDLCYIHRPNNKEHLEAITVARKNGVPVWIDYDDDLINIPQTNPAYHAYNGKRDIIKDIVSLSDVVTVSTEGLRDNLNSAFHHSNISVVENFVPEDRLTYVTPVKKGKFRILWRGSNTHEADWIEHKEAFIEFLKDKKNVSFTCIGDMPLTIRKEIEKYCEVIPVFGRRLIDYLLWLRTGVADVIFVPLEDNLFNRAKSSIACQEGLLGGMDSVAPEWNTDFGYTYGNVTESLQGAYEDWMDNHTEFKQNIITDQGKQKELYQQRYEKRLIILKNILGI